MFFWSACLCSSLRFLSHLLLYLGVGELSLALWLEPRKPLWLNCCKIVFFWWKERLQIDTYSITIKTLHFKIPLKICLGSLLWGQMKGDWNSTKMSTELDIKWILTKWILWYSLIFSSSERNIQAWRLPEWQRQPTVPTATHPLIH